MIIKANVLDRQFYSYKSQYEEAVLRVLNSGWYILGKEVEQFEQEYAEYMNSKYCVGLNSGLDALILAIRALGIGPGDEVIVPANTYIASVLGITENGAIPIYVEPDEFYNIDFNKIEESITDKTKAIMVVHLYGQAANMEEICKIAKKHNLYLVEDCAQSHIAKYNGQFTGTFGDVGCFSFFPTKNLGAFGDAGAIISNNKELSRRIRMMRNYGSEIKYHNEIEGVNSRLDEIQAAVLRVKLQHLEDLTSQRRYIATRYINEIKNKNIILPKQQINSTHVWHLFVIRTSNRVKFQQFMSENGIDTQIHYPIPPHLSECYAHYGYKVGDFPITESYANTVISLPLYNGMTDKEISYVVSVINKFEDGVK